MSRVAIHHDSLLKRSNRIFFRGMSANYVWRSPNSGQAFSNAHWSAFFAYIKIFLKEEHIMFSFQKYFLLTVDSASEGFDLIWSFAHCSIGGKLLIFQEKFSFTANSWGHSQGKAIIHDSILICTFLVLPQSSLKTLIEVLGRQIRPRPFFFFYFWVQCIRI